MNLFTDTYNHIHNSKLIGPDNVVRHYTTTRHDKTSSAVATVQLYATATTVRLTARPSVRGRPQPS